MSGPQGLKPTVVREAIDAGLKACSTLVSDAA